MAAITISPTPIKNGMGRGFWADLAEYTQKAIDHFGDSTSNFTTANTVAEFLVAVKAARDQE